MNEFTFRGELEKQGAKDITWDGANNGVRATVGGKSYFYDTSGLENRNGTLYGSAEQIKEVLKSPMQHVRNTAVSQGVDVNNVGTKPYLNGQEISTDGMVLSGDNWYANGKALNGIIEGVKPKEYVSPYKDMGMDLLDELLNYKDFSYDPDNDENLQKDMGFAKRQAMRDAVNRGQGSSFGMEYAASSAANELIPKYRQQAYEEHQDGIDFLLDLMGIVSDYDDRDYERYADDRKFTADDKAFYEEQTQFDKNYELDSKKQYDDNLLDWAKHNLEGMQYLSDQEQRAIENALEICDKVGYITEKAAAILGVPAGTRTVDFLNYTAKLR